MYYKQATARVLVVINVCPLFSKSIHHVSRWLSLQAKVELLHTLSASSLVNTENAKIFKKIHHTKEFSKRPEFGNKMQVADWSS